MSHPYGCEREAAESLSCPTAGGRLDRRRCSQLQGAGIHTWWDRSGTEFAAWIVAFYRNANAQPAVNPKEAVAWLVQMAEVCIGEGVDAHRADLLTSCIKYKHESGKLNDAFLIVSGDLKATVGANVDDQASLGRLDIKLEAIPTAYFALAK